MILYISLVYGVIYIEGRVEINLLNIRLIMIFISYSTTTCHFVHFVGLRRDLTQSIVIILTQSIVIEIQHSLQTCTKSNFAIENFCGCHSDLRGKGIRVSPAWYYSKRQRQLCLSTQQHREMNSDLKSR